MAAPEFIAQDSDGWRDDASVSAGGLQVLDRNTQWLRNERLPVVGTAFRQITSTQADTAQLPIWYAARWTAGPPLRYYAPPALRALDGTAVVDVVLSFAVTGTMYLVAVNEADGAPAESALDEAVAGSADSAATLTSSDSSVRLTVRVRPGMWNVLRVCFRSEASTSSLSSSPLPVAFQPFWDGDSLAVQHGGSVAAMEPLWVALSTDASPSIDTARPVYTAARCVEGGGVVRFYVAETEYGRRPRDSVQSYDGRVYWDSLGTISLTSVSVDPNSVQSDQVDNARLRWRQGLGQALERMAIDVRAAHRARAPQYALICDQAGIDTITPSTWRHGEINTTSGGTVDPSGLSMGSWTIRWRDVYGDIDSYLECDWSVMLVGTEGVDASWRLAVYAIGGTLTDSETRVDTLPPSQPSTSRTARWVWESATTAGEWAMRGCTHISDIGTVWQRMSLRVSTDLLTDGGMYFVSLELTAAATETQGFITVDGASCRLVLS